MIDEEDMIRMRNLNGKFFFAYIHICLFNFFFEIIITRYLYIYCNISVLLFQNCVGEIM